MSLWSAERPRWRNPLMARVQWSGCQVSRLLPESLRHWELYLVIDITLEGPFDENFWRPLLTEHSLILSFWALCVSCSFDSFCFEVIEALQSESPSPRCVPWPSCLLITCLNLSTIDFFGLGCYHTMPVIPGRFSDQDFHNPPRSKSLNEHNSGQFVRSISNVQLGFCTLPFLHSTFACRFFPHCLSRRWNSYALYLS